MFPYVNLFSIEISASYIFWGIGIIVAQVYFQLRGKEFGLTWWESLLLGVLFLLAEMVGAKILFLLENPEKTELAFQLSGFSLLGVFFSVPFFSFLYAKIFRVPFLKLIDYSFGGILWELAFYRIGCFCSGCCGGIPWEYGLEFPDGIRYFPAQIVEVVFDLGIYFTIIRFSKSNRLIPGGEYASLLILYGCLRFILEFFRERNNIIGSFSDSHFIALALCLSGVLFFLIKKKNADFLQWERKTE